MARIHDELALVKQLFELAQKFNVPFDTPYGEMRLIPDFGTATLCQLTDNKGVHVMPLRHIVQYILRRYW